MRKQMITEKEIKHILRNRETLLLSIHQKMVTIEKDIEKTDDMIVSMSLPTNTMSEMPKGSAKQKDLGDVYRNYKKILKQRNEDYKAMYWELILQEQLIEQVWDAYMRLEEPYYSIINRMYVQSMLYAAVERESGWSRQVFEKKRKKGIGLILDRINNNGITEEKKSMKMYKYS